MKATRVLGTDMICVECPACGHYHCFDERWKFNGDFENPTFEGSMLVRWGSAAPGNENSGEPPGVCHSFVQDGFIRFEQDCTHDKRGLTFQLEDI